MPMSSEILQTVHKLPHRPLRPHKKESRRLALHTVKPYVLTSNQSQPLGWFTFQKILLHEPWLVRNTVAPCFVMGVFFHTEGSLNTCDNIL